MTEGFGREETSRSFQDEGKFLFLEEHELCSKASPHGIREFKEHKCSLGQ